MESSPTAATPMGNPVPNKSYNFVHAKITSPIYSGMIVQNPELHNQQVKPDELVFLPLNEVKVDVTIHESIALVRMEQEFVNPTRDPAGKQAAPIEVVYKCPKLANSVVSKLHFIIGDDRTIEAIIVDKFLAENK